MSPLIELTNISKTYGNVVGVDHVEMAVDGGAFLTLLGPSGCGKSTLLRMIGGFETPTTGSIRLEGRDVTDLPAQKRDVNMMFQDYALFPHMTVHGNIAYGLNRKGIKGDAATRKTRDALELVGLPDTFDRFPGQLSGGQRQRIALARAIVREPKVILLDEPLSALDANLREQMQIELKQMHQKLGITFVMVTHDQTEALVMSDRVVVMERGRVAQDGSPEDLYERPATRYVANFIGTTNFLAADLIDRVDGRATVRAAGQRVTVRVRDRDAAGPLDAIGIRPEKSRIVGPADTSEHNSLPGRIEDVIYHGSTLRSMVRLQDGSIFMVDEILAQRMTQSSHPRRGDAVRVEFSADNVLLFDK